MSESERIAIRFAQARARLLEMQGDFAGAARLRQGAEQAAAASAVAAAPATTDEVLRGILAKLDAIHREIVAQRQRSNYTPGG